MKYETDKASEEEGYNSVVFKVFMTLKNSILWIYILIPKKKWIKVKTPLPLALPL